MRTNENLVENAAGLAGRSRVQAGLLCAGVILAFATVTAQSPSAPPAAPQEPSPPAVAAGAGVSAGAPAGSAVTPPPDYVIGPDDVLSIFFWREKDLSSDVVVRPDGKISLPVVNEIQALGLTPEQLRQSVVKAATRFFSEEPTVNVIVKQINSRKVFILGQVSKPGPYPLLETTTVLQLIAKAGGLTEYADKKHVRIIRAEKRPDGVNWQVEVNYADILNGVNLKQNVELKPGDTVIVK
jgi:polysaccharide biosynthesis/export protein